VPTADEIKLLSETYNSLRSMHMQRQSSSAQPEPPESEGAKGGEAGAASSTDLTAATRSAMEFSRREVVRILLNHNDFITIR
jgi:hypothetical protein